MLRKRAKVLLFAFCISFGTVDANAQTVEDGSDAVVGKAVASTVLDLIGQRFKELDPRVSGLRRAKGSWICGSVNVKNRDGLYIGERGFVVDLSNAFFGRVPEGPELLNPRAAGFASLERIRQLYFDMCLD
ncbi:hypothetical protein [Methylobacterium marchantiae]|uniref:Uncharacterized protein n=1 Tax=Methylobacterium marchantiae TaxID=600331 RepID=A0ABW3WYC4_9HYPH|nr:hypothetical protein AIGOOFII_1633 [Methylobacterium marchantiae]